MACGGCRRSKKNKTDSGTVRTTAVSTGKAVEVAPEKPSVAYWLERMKQTTNRLGLQKEKEPSKMNNKHEQAG